MQIIAFVIFSHGLGVIIFRMICARPGAVELHVFCHRNRQPKSSCWYIIAMHGCLSSSRSASTWPGGSGIIYLLNHHLAAVKIITSHYLAAMVVIYTKNITIWLAEDDGQYYATPEYWMTSTCIHCMGRVEEWAFLEPHKSGMVPLTSTIDGQVPKHCTCMRKPRFMVTT